MFEHDYPRLLQQLPAALAPHATYVRRPWPAADKVRLRALPHVWVDVFVLRRYESLDQVRQAVQLKDNGQLQPQQYIDAILGPIATAEAGGAPRFPLWHYDCRKALEMWPSEFFTQARLLLAQLPHSELQGSGRAFCVTNQRHIPLIHTLPCPVPARTHVQQWGSQLTLLPPHCVQAELLPLRHDYRFGHLVLPGPAHPVGHLRRAFGPDVFTVFKAATSHVEWCKEIRDRLQAATAKPQAAPFKEQKPLGQPAQPGRQQRLEQQAEQKQQHQEQQHQEQPREQQGKVQLQQQQQVQALVSGAAQPLLDEHFVPVQHSRRSKRVESQHCRAALIRYLDEAERAWALVKQAQTVSLGSRDGLAVQATDTTAGTAGPDGSVEAVHAPSTSAGLTSSLAAVTAPPCPPASASGLVPDEPAAMPAAATPPAATAGPAHTRQPPAAAAAPRSGSVAKPSWFGAAVRQHTRGSAEPFDFTPNLLAVMEPHIAKARALRAGTLAKLPPLPPCFAPLTAEARAAYDVQAHDLGAALVEALGLPRGSDLTSFHKLAAAAGGKQAVMGRLRCAQHRSAFHVAYDAFVRGVVAPHIAATLPGGCTCSSQGTAGSKCFKGGSPSSIGARPLAADVTNMCRAVQPRVAPGASCRSHTASNTGSDGSSCTACATCNTCDTLHYQSFPCVRVIQPGEFSLGPHCDAAYGHHAAIVNIVVPLTPDAGAAALYVESGPGCEDWHPVTGGPGTFTRFHGAHCLHWTSENSTPHTRVSLDFRVIPGSCWGHDGRGGDADAFCRAPGYYLAASRRRLQRGAGGGAARDAESGGSTEWLREGRKEEELPEPTRLMGYPFS